MAEKGLNCGINKTVIMATKITVPDIGDFENVEIIEILTKPGSIIKKDDPIVTLESDKSSVEVPSPFSGKISSLEVKIGDKVSIKELIDEQHFTDPPPRYSEASLVKKMEELGIGRPSTYASIISVLSTRNYVDLLNKRFHPTDRGKLLSAFLEKLFSKYVDYNFTADLENQLD